MKVDSGYWLGFADSLPKAEQRAEFLELVPALLGMVYDKPSRCFAVSIETIGLSLNGRLGPAYLIDFQSMDLLPQTAIEGIVEQLQIAVLRVMDMPANHGLIRIIPSNVFGELFWNPNTASSSVAQELLHNQPVSRTPRLGASSI